jgi:hypothetical protein
VAPEPSARTLDRGRRSPTVGDRLTWGSLWHSGFESLKSVGSPSSYSGPVPNVSAVMGRDSRLAAFASVEALDK